MWEELHQLHAKNLRFSMKIPSEIQNTFKNQAKVFGVSGKSISGEKMFSSRGPSKLPVVSANHWPLFPHPTR